MVAAANCDLETLAVSGIFRPDLLYRLDVLRVKLPPLRHRRADIPLLARHVVKRIAERYKQVKRLSEATLAWLTSQDWHGNVRELENWVHRHYLLSTGEVIELGADITASKPQDGDDTPPLRTAKREAIADFERRYLSKLIASTRGNVSAASRRSGTERRALGRLFRKHGIEPSAYR